MNSIDCPWMSSRAEWQCSDGDDGRDGRAANLCLSHAIVKTGHRSVLSRERVGYRRLSHHDRSTQNQKQTKLEHWASVTWRFGLLSFCTQRWANLNTRKNDSVIEFPQHIEWGERSLICWLFGQLVILVDATCDSYIFTHKLRLWYRWKTSRCMNDKKNHRWSHHRISRRKQRDRIITNRKKANHL